MTLDRAEQARHDEFTAVSRRNRKAARQIDLHEPCQATFDGGRTTQHRVDAERSRVRALFRAAEADKT